MLRNCLAAALRNIARYRFDAMLSVACLAVGLAATFLAVAYIDHLNSYNQWIDAHQQAYRIAMQYTLPGAEPLDLDTTPQDVAAWVKANVGGVSSAARIITARKGVRHGDVEAFEEIAWADTELFEVLPLRRFLGDPAAALRQPDSLVVTRSTARKYFGTDQALGRTLELDREQLLVVRAVIEDLPQNTHLTSSQIGMLAAATASFSPMSTSSVPWSAFTFVRVDAATTVGRLNAALERYRQRGSVKVRLQALPLAELAYSSDRRAIAHAMPLLAALVLLISCMNFVNLTTARSIHRSTEVGVRKAAGAGRRHLIGQFMGEALLFSVAGMTLGLSLSELSLPFVRTLLDVPLTFEYWRNPSLLLAIVGITLATALLSGFYPALLLSRMRPASILNGGRANTGQSRKLRQGLVVFQFTALAALATAVIGAREQVDHLLQATLRFDGERVVLITTSCRTAFVNEVRKVSGVTGAACSESAPLNLVTNNLVAERADGTKQMFEAVRVDPGFLELYDLKPLAGRFFTSEQPADLATSGSSARVVINATAARRFGFDSAQSAIGRNPFPGTAQSYEIIGVVDDFRLGRLEEPMLPMVYFAGTTRSQLLSVKLRGERVAQTLSRIDALWKSLGDPTPIDRFFLSDSIEGMHRSVVRQRSMLATFAVLSVSLAMIGMLGLASSSAAERRLEVGIRKAFGAGMTDIAKLLLWRFVKLAALAGILGCCAALLFLNRWLQSFHDRIELGWWMFVAPFAIVICIAVTTVLAQTVSMARARAITSLRYE